MQKTKLNILSTRPLNIEIIKEAERQNIYIDCISFIETEPLNTPELKKIIQNLGQQKITIVFTSMNAVNSVTENLTLIPEWSIFSIGQTTKELVIDFFGKETILATANDANSLADAIIARGEKEIIFFCGDQRREELPGKLKANNIKVKEVVVYHTVVTPQVVSKKYDGILFFSPSAAESFFSVNTIAKDVILFAIGNTTADAINKMAKNKIIIAEQPGKEALVKKMLTYFDTQKQVS